MSHVYIIGLGMIRFNKYPDGNVRQMAAAARQPSGRQESRHMRRSVR